MTTEESCQKMGNVTKSLFEENFLPFWKERMIPMPIKEKKRCYIRVWKGKNLFSKVTY